MLLDAVRSRKIDRTPHSHARTHKHTLFYTHPNEYKWFVRNECNDLRSFYFCVKNVFVFFLLVFSLQHTYKWSCCFETSIELNTHTYTQETRKWNWNREKKSERKRHIETEIEIQIERVCVCERLRDQNQNRMEKII